MLTCRADHPALSKQISRTTLSNFSYTEVPLVYTGYDKLDSLLLANNVVREITISVPTFAGACHIVGASDIVSILPRTIVLAHQTSCNLAYRVLPFRMPKLEISALIHRRNSGDPGLLWLLEILAGGVKKI